MQPNIFHILLFFTENVEFFRFFSIFFGFFLGFFRFFRFYRFFRFIRFVSKQFVSIEPKQTEDPPKQFKREYIWKFFQKFRVVSVVSKQICLFRLFRYRFETPKQTEIFPFWFHETNRNERETDLVSVCFGSSRKLFLFVSRTPYFCVIPRGSTEFFIAQYRGIPFSVLHGIPCTFKVFRIRIGSGFDWVNW